MTTIRLTAAAALFLASVAIAQSETIKLGYLTDTSGPTQDISKPTLDGFNLYIDRSNKAGGVNGRKIEVDIRDTGIDTARAVATAQELIANGSVAIIGLPLSTVQAGVYAAMERDGVPVVAGYPSNIGLVLPPAKLNAFATGIVFDLAGYIGGELARDVAPKGKTMICTSFESPGGIVSCKGAVASAKLKGFTTAESVMFPISTRDFRAIGERIAAHKPDVVVAVLGRSRLIAMVPALASAGYKGAVVSMEAGTGDDAVRDVAKAAPQIDVWSYTRFVSQGYGDGPQVTALQNALKDVGIKEWNSVHAGAWALGMLVEDVVKRCASPCTTEKFQAALVETKMDTGGLTGGPIQFTKDDHYGPTTYLLVQYDRTKDQMVPRGGWRAYSSTLPKF
jgi:branched-chain amino acid transport system substrate-binding protein